MSAPNLTAQEVFDLAVGGCLKQGVRCVDGDNSCVYRGLNGTKCAAGFVFTDAEVNGMNEGYSASEILADRAPRLNGHEQLLYQLQKIHDQGAVSLWPESFRQFAADYGLSPAVIDAWEAEQPGGAA